MKQSANQLCYTESGMLSQVLEAKGSPCWLSIEPLEGLASLWRTHEWGLQWTCPFVLPPWLESWYRVFGHDIEPLIAIVRQGEAAIGVAPLMIQDSTIRFLGSPNVCDYFDCVVAAGKEGVFFRTLFHYLTSHGLKDLQLGPVRPDATISRLLLASETFRSLEQRREEQEVSVQVDLPGSWDEFLGTLNGKQRHEVRRKLRRLHEAGEVRFHLVDDPAQLPNAVEIFLRLFTTNRADKAAFMTEPMAAFFRELALALAAEGMLRLYLLDVDEKPVASVFCFDHQGTRYLYNNGYDEAYRAFSVGLMSKVLSLKAAIDDGLSRYDFLKGNEEYKLRLGGTEVPLSTFHGRLD